MNSDDFQRICLTFARDLDNRFGAGLPEHVEAALAGSAAPLHGGRMTDIGGLMSVGADVSGVLISLVSTVFAYLAIPKRGKTGTTPLRPVDPKTLPGLTEALDEAVADLGGQQRHIGKQLQAEIIAWLLKQPRD